MASSGRMMRALLKQPQVIGRNMSTSGPLSLDLSGVYPPITTPFNPDESIAWDQLENNIAKWNQIKLKGFLVQGSNGEYCYLTHQERIDMIEKVKKFAADDKIVLAGSGCESTTHTIEMTKAMAQVGADAAVIITPCYFKGKMNGEALKQHYLRVADNVPIPVVLYSVPANTGIDLPVQIVKELSGHPNIIGMKESGGDIAKIGEMVHLTKDEDFQVLAGSASFLMASLQVGAVGGICALANALPQEVVELQSLVERSALGQARDLQHRLITPNAIVTKGLGVPGLKKAMDWLGYYGGPTRSPLLPLNTGETARLRNVFQSQGFLSA
ncbi:4-hydroxy-2-oxoglutarate aldolase, mitochondrial-like [Tigriopus californicus]|uniref:4-hydroxy-2-oxoglutarate aldolase, mitochondrial-like n=1 Tax=Tigriopus californicus TaxID=6832 RepID=UPI0027DA30EC|nr:4-hydroxy-2-oxoglutarate aldolase, mitochondrial-like [Tigriopus californicus]|eukprot:TCALIF_09028-PA protein Name:"Similar to zgc:77082 4-hydroxy-2-oxoglutarate aldolase, mitochondrial (Danio rerio)" AED:0.04 eAED:0.04 QI:98/1/1/1/0.66/0.5/4/42/326